MYVDVMYGDIKAFHFDLYEWVDPAEFICECNLPPEIYLISKIYVVIP